MAGNAFLLSIIYLLVGIAVEGARRVYPSTFVQRLSLSLDALPARALEFVGAMEPLRRVYLNGKLPEYQVRLIFGVTTVAIIFVLAFVVGLIVGGLRSYVERRALRKYNQGGRG
ncbi:hypothetical protein [Hyalangium rubrum]|uniref:YggT family protein n=1 Tax=Hyalangium rubrum TaxID=3103134 RepID=A0ABU5HA47_9BACT|nr:hypothetical protein [Hyalangium sp. s54d21]MDY7228985.1 hypothetical protein [Hyalangium sp. s54d21]